MPVVEYMLVRCCSLPGPVAIRDVDWWRPPLPSTFALSTLKGRLSRLPPQSEDGASARTEASVSMDRRRRRLLEEASVRMEALSVRRLFAVAVL